MCNRCCELEASMRTKNLTVSAWIKIGIFALFTMCAFVLVRHSLVLEFLTAERFSVLLDRSGFWAPAVFIALYAAAVCLFVPGSLMTAIGAAIFGAWWGFLFVWIGAMTGAAVAFLVGRYLGRDFAANIAGERLRKYDDAIERNGFATVLYLRLIYFPFTLMNFGMGMTRVRFPDYLLGTGLGILVGTFIFTFFVGTMKEVWLTGRWEQLLHWKVFFSLGLFIFSFFIPAVLKRIGILERQTTGRRE